MSFGEPKGLPWGVAAIALLMTGCGPSLREQCGAIGQVTRETMNSVQTAYDAQIGKALYDPALEQRLAQAWEQGAEAVAAVEVRDRSLKRLQADLQQAYEKAADLRRQAAELIPADGRVSGTLETQISDFHQRSEVDVAETITALNRYCISGGAS